MNGTRPRAALAAALAVAALTQVGTSIAGGPTVLSLRTVADSGAPLGEGAALDGAVSQLRIAFSQPMFDAPGNLTPGDVDALASYRLVDAGADGVVQTSDCDATAGDDVLLALFDASYAAAAQSVSLGAAAPALPRGGYALLACDTLSGVGGAPLDGDGDGLPGGDYVRRFAIRRTHLLSNSSFNGGIGAWSISNLGSPGATWAAAFDARDAGDAPSSGSLRVEAQPGASIDVYQCIDLAALPWQGNVYPTAMLRPRVLTGRARVVVDLWVSFAPESGGGCWGPGVAARAFDAVLTPQATFEVAQGPDLIVPQFPYVNLSIGVVPLEPDTSLLIDDVQLGFGEARFSSSFEGTN